MNIVSWLWDNFPNGYSMYKHVETIKRDIEVFDYHGGGTVKRVTVNVKTGDLLINH